MAQALKVNRTFRGETSSTGTDVTTVWMYDVYAEDLTFTLKDAKVADDGTTAIPAMNSSDPEVDGIVSQIDAVRDQDLPTLIRVTVTWKSSTQSVDTGGTAIWDIQMGFDREAYTTPRNIDLNSPPLPIVNSAGDPFDPAPEFKQSDPVYLYAYTCKNADWNALGDAHGCTNQGPVTLTFNGRSKSFDKNTLMIEPRFSVIAVIHSDVYYRIEYRLTYRKDGYGLKLLDKGYRTKETVTSGSGSGGSDGGSGGSSDTMRVPNHEGGQLAEIYLDGKGKKLADGAQQVLVPTDSNGQTLPDGWKMAKSYAFTSLPGFGG